MPTAIRIGTAQIDYNGVVIDQLDGVDGLNIDRAARFSAQLVEDDQKKTGH
jgi:hypothetical protein